MKNFYISDLHFGHANVIKFDNRPFENVEEMEEKMISNWNSVVSNGDTVYILGDFCWGTEKEWIEILKKLNGNKVLIKGNHDLKQISGKLRKCFTDIKDYKEIIDNNRRVIMSHYPILCYKRSYDNTVWMLHGHTHNTREQQFVETWTKELKDSHKNKGDNWGQLINVGCMRKYMDYTPKTLDELIIGAGY